MSRQSHNYISQGTVKVPEKRNRIELRLRHVNQLFNSLDPSPFYEQDLDPDAEEFIVGWARELPRNSPLDIVLHLTEPRTDALSHSDAEQKIGGAFALYFSTRTKQEDRRLRELLRTGRVSFVIGLLFLFVCFLIAHFVGSAENDRNPFVPILRESFIIIGWVAMWRPLEIFLYDWWPIAGARRLYQSLSAAEFVLVEDKD
ncbi:MAG: hypothetical protein Q8M16_21710 [Pirellulaceae bacterium]|nr:hypothetical protein [Pirellulaceae bacterium]